MIRRSLTAAVLLALSSAGLVVGSPAPGPVQPPADLQRLAQAYPDAFRITCRNGWGVLFPDGRFIPWDEGRRHDSYPDLLARPNLKDMFAFDYPPLSADSSSVPPPDFDPGRVRHQEFFQALYGATRDEVEQQLRRVPWMPGSTPPDQEHSLLVTTAFGIADRVERISARMEALPGEYHRYLLPPAGAYFWRRIAGTSRLSMHSFGIAIDINPAYGAYWQWDEDHLYRSQLPREIIQIFEDEGFIWGGRWYHYDTFHFEYRPELLSPLIP